MWCTRWFIPLLLLPLPSAPPYFLVLFLLSLTLHARPCFYCIILLTALFLSSCYWQPVPIDTPVSSAWTIASNGTITTFASALVGMAGDKRPAVVRLADRCWCEMSASKLFEPFDIAAWESSSVEGLKEEVERERRLVAGMNATANVEGGEDSVAVSEEESEEAAEVPQAKKSHSIFSHFPPFSHRKHPSTVAAPMPPTPSSNRTECSDAPTVPPVTPPPTPASEKLDLLRWEYDLRPYGLSMVVDFGWSR